MAFDIKRLIYFLLLALVQTMYILVPSVDFLPFRNPTVSGKFIVFLFLIEITTLLALIRIVFINKAITVSLVDVLFIGVLVYITLNRYFFQPVYGFSIRYYELLGLLALYLVLKSVKDGDFYHSLFVAVIIGANIQIIMGLLQLYGLIKPNSNYLKVTGSFFNSGPYAGYLSAVLPISLYMLKWNRTRGIARYLLMLNILGCVALIPALKSRACYLSVLYTVLFIYYNEIRSVTSSLLQKKLTRYISIFILLISTTAIVYFLFSFKRDSSEGRYLVLKAASRMAIDKPILGFGYDRFRSDYMNYQASYFTRSSDKKETILAANTVYTFNEPFQFFVENGAIGFILVACFLGVLLKYSKNKDDFTSIATTGLGAIFVFSLFSYPSEILPIKLLCFLYISILAVYAAPFTIRVGLNRSMGVVLLILGLPLFYQAFTYTLRLKDAYTIWGRSFADYKSEHFAHGKVGCQSIYPVFKTNGEFLTDYGKILFSTSDYQEGIAVLRRAKKYINNTIVETALGDCEAAIGNYTNAERSYILAVYMTPNSFYNRYSLFRLYQQTGQGTKAVKVANEILSLTVKVPSEFERKARNEAVGFLGKAL